MTVSALNASNEITKNYDNIKGNSKNVTLSAWDTLGVLLTKQGRYQEALEALLRAGKLNASEPSVQIHLAEAYLKHGDKQKAGKLANELINTGVLLSIKDRETIRKIRDSVGAQ